MAKGEGGEGEVHVDLLQAYLPIDLNPFATEREELRTEHRIPKELCRSSKPSYQGTKPDTDTTVLGKEVERQWRSPASSQPQRPWILAALSTDSVLYNHPDFYPLVYAPR